MKQAFSLMIVIAIHMPWGMPAVRELCVGRVMQKTEITEDLTVLLEDSVIMKS